MTATIYARVTDELKDATDRYAEDHGMSLASAVSDLLERGLESASGDQAVRALEVRTKELQSELTRVREAAVAVDDRMDQVLGTCKCGHELTGRDLLLVGRCPSCKQGVGGLFAGTADGGSINRAELAPFMAGVGVALALIVLAYAASKE
jgi:predicted Zn-ribbon and HTH transcriptional regulator